MTIWKWKITVKTQSWNPDKNNFDRSWFAPKRYTSKSCCFWPENVHVTICVPFCRITNSNKMKFKFQSIIASLIRFSIAIFLHNAVLVRFGSMKSRKIDLQISPPETSRNFHEEAIMGKIGGEIRFCAKKRKLSDFHSKIECYDDCNFVFTLSCAFDGAVFISSWDLSSC